MDPWCCDNVKGLDGLEGVGNYPRPFILSGAIDYLSLKSRTFLDKSANSFWEIREFHQVGVTCLDGSWSGYEIF
ncbi:predicted protein [Botrytis cinerea T4]|uniref:Uncharacterized protein n=1 Tax=Botryotinia fuckeliana (strain T4) TaxID=999810 RepID=G2YW61_BOTF4|nr:predicted protein [Botrytis cinerea T4]